jgi:hypothetical protein
MIIARNATADEIGACFTPDFTGLCAPDTQSNAAEWQVSRALKQELWKSRLSCSADAQGGPVLRVTLHPGDAADPNPGHNPTERVEIQLRRPVVRFDEPVWYRFRFRLLRPWLGIGNRTVIHQVKQNIEPGQEAPSGPCAPANPLFKIEARPTAAGAAFLVKVKGVVDCRDGGDQKTICGPWPMDVGHWHQVRVLLQASQQDGASNVRVSLDGRGCPPYSGRLGYRDQGRRDAAGRPVINVQPRFGIYRDALPDNVQSIEFAGITFWHSDPSGDPAWLSTP